MGFLGQHVEAFAHHPSGESKISLIIIIIFLNHGKNNKNKREGGKKNGAERNKSAAESTDEQVEFCRRRSANDNSLPPLCFLLTNRTYTDVAKSEIEKRL